MNTRTIRLIFFLGAATLLAQTPLERSSAIQGLDQWSSVCEKDGLLLWGKSLCGPMLLVDPSTRSAIANRPDPAGTFRKQGSIYIGTLPEQFTPSNTSIHWRQQSWSMVMLPLPDDPFLRVALLAHESFHRVQPDLGLGASDAPDPGLDAEAGRLWMRMELRALARALRSEASPGRQSAMDAMLFRTYRDQLCPGTEKMEAAMEKQEGLPEYTGVFIGLRETGESISREARIVEAFEDSEAYARSFGYAIGPVLGLLLDRYGPGWRAGIAKAESLHSMLIAALKFQPPADVQRLAMQRAELYGYSAVASAEREREERHRALLGELKMKFVDGPTLDFPSAPEMNRSFNPHTLVPFPPYGTFYPTGTFTANWGELDVESGGVLVAPDNRSLRLPAPSDIKARPVRGPGWTLQLAPGWAIQRAERAGSYVVIPPERK
ncbi:MAG: hypothetical protein JOY53_10210 [Acidobacteriaceae bacterium]|nr:hypothetical protein [Acidobacteriaceae bacterium]